MLTLFKDGFLIDTIKKKIIKADVLVKDKKIIKVGSKLNVKADKVINIKGKWICPGFIEGHIHIESSKLSPFEFAKVVIKNGTTSVVADPHEIANVAGTKGIDFMLKMSKTLPIDIFYMIPSCVPATKFDEQYEPLNANKIAKYLTNTNVLGLAEVMDYVAVINEDKNIIDKINLFKKANKIIDGHAPGLLGKKLEKYVSHGIMSDHECSTLKEAQARYKLGQWIMIREGSASKNLYALLPLLEGNTSDKCMLVSDDRDPIDLLHKGHINHVVQMCLDKGIDFFKAICAATINPARYFKQKDLGAIAPNYRANFLILDNIKQLNIKQVYHNGKLVCNQGKTIGFKKPIINKKEFDHIFNSIDFKPIKLSDLRLPYKGKHKARIISLTSMEIISKQIIKTIDFDKNNGIDLKNDILKLVVVERHHKTGHIGIGLTTGFKLKTGAIASTVAHDSHNIIVVGTNDKDIMVAINSMKKLGGGQLVVKNGKVIAHLAMPIAGLMSNKDIKTVVEENIKATKACYQLGVNKKIQPFMNMAFLSLPVIPELRLTTKGLVDVNQYKIVDLIIKSY